LNVPEFTSVGELKAMNKTIAWSILMVLGPLNSTSHAQPPDDVAQQFVGMWRQVSRPQRLADGTTKQNPLSVACVIYPDTGHMCYVAMDPNRPRWKSATAPTPEEALSGIGSTGFSAYCASVEIHAKEGFVVHHVEIEKSPNIVGRARKRWFTFDGANRLSLRIDTPELTAPVVEDALIWERVVK
jgi:Lipocalin-like domain